MQDCTKVRKRDMIYKNTTPEYFLMVARERNITRAAEKLFITQPSLSQHIAKLERSLGCQLFDRSKIPLELTSAGKIYYHYLESCHYLDEKLKAELNNEKLQQLNIGIGTWRGSPLMPAILPGFLKDHPAVKVNLLEFPVSELPVLLEDNRIDFAVMNAMISQLPQEIIAETIKEERVLLILAKDHPLCRVFLQEQEKGEPLDLHLLEQESFVNLGQQQTVGKFINNYLMKQKLSFSRKLTTTNNATLLRLIANGLGFGFMIEAGLQDPATERLEFFDLKAPELMLPLTLLTKENVYLSPAARDLLQAIREYYQ